ncbi:hypothetical protein MtrunA17_Chr4g0057011 [Medicago truncatula]|uniref:Copper ion-binding protein, putative n=1 Tax=Medicago truncatula TaxID=3880 RepID=A0A072UPA7_MEDTR|nr:uncharacterized protein LOC25493628 [Medicago truncatula]KEH31679.1 copper ion-binding protein, putative [Medicago truncatula]RHN63319.1 hypothetical protein MtrunA17_Chr4g0057011 [Medicago truncatula]
MGEFTIQISNDLVNKLVDDPVVKKKPRRVKRKVAREIEKPQPNVAEEAEIAPAPVWPVQPALYVPATLPAHPSQSELEGIRSVLQESEKVLERLQKQEKQMLQEVTQKAKDLHEKEYKVPDPKPERCTAERLASLTCYKEHIKDPLKCAGFVNNFADCLRRLGPLGGK